MTINMQGAWTIKVTGKNAAYPQRFRVAGATTGNGDYDGTVGFSIFVNGSAWGVTIESAPAGPTSWTPSAVRMTSFRTEADGTFRFNLTSNDPGNDQDFDDLVLECSMVLSEAEHVIYGRVRTYHGPCLFNPCYPSSFWVIESPKQLRELLKNASARRVLERLYGETVLRHDRRQPGAEAFKPLMIPTGEAEPPALVVHGGRPLAREARQPLEAMPAISTRLIATRPRIATRLPQPLRPARARLIEEAGTVRESAVELAAGDLLAVARLRDRLRLVCRTSPLPQTLLRVLEYDRTQLEKLGGPYSGEGPRQLLGETSTDDAGWYVFRFSRTIADIAAEQADVGPREDPAVALRPDLILQVLDSLPDGVVYESPAYFDVANVRRIDLCFDAEQLPQPTTSCQGGRAIQALGDMLLVNPGTVLHDDGTISNTASSGPAVQHAAWRGTIDLYACFLQTASKVRWYTVRYREIYSTGASPWAWVTEPYSHPKQQLDGSWVSQLVGPLPGVSLHVNGDSAPAVETPAYDNIEEDTTWLHTHRDRKVYLKTWRYTSAAGAGQIEFQLQGWSATGKLVASDAVMLYLDNHSASGAIASITHGSLPFNTCALLELPNSGATLDVKLRVDEVEGFLSNWSLVAYRGSSVSVPIESGGSPIGGSYSNVAPFRFYGTTPVADATGYVSYAVTPTSGAWLPADRSFCAFSFELHAAERTTDGKSVPGSFVMWRELVGISVSPPPTP